MVMGAQISIKLAEDEPLNLLRHMEASYKKGDTITNLLEMESRWLQPLTGVDTVDNLVESNSDKEKNGDLVVLANEKGYASNSNMQDTLAKLSVRQSKWVST